MNTKKKKTNKRKEAKKKKERRKKDRKKEREKERKKDREKVRKKERKKEFNFNQFTMVWLVKECSITVGNSPKLPDCDRILPALARAWIGCHRQFGTNGRYNSAQHHFRWSSSQISKEKHGDEG